MTFSRFSLKQLLVYLTAAAIGFGLSKTEAFEFSDSQWLFALCFCLAVGLAEQTVDLWPFRDRLGWWPVIWRVGILATFSCSLAAEFINYEPDWSGPHAWTETAAILTLMSTKPRRLGRSQLIELLGWVASGTLLVLYFADLALVEALVQIVIVGIAAAQPIAFSGPSFLDIQPREYFPRVYQLWIVSWCGYGCSIAAMLSVGRFRSQRVFVLIWAISFVLMIGYLLWFHFVGYPAAAPQLHEAMFASHWSEYVARGWPLVIACAAIGAVWSSTPSSLQWRRGSVTYMHEHRLVFAAFAAWGGWQLYNWTKSLDWEELPLLARYIPTSEFFLASIAFILMGIWGALGRRSPPASATISPVHFVRVFMTSFAAITTMTHALHACSFTYWLMP